MMIFWHPTGPRVEYTNGMLRIADLNPQKEMKWRMSRIEMLRFGWHCILSALKRKR